MRSVGASKVALSSISSQNLWKQTGRLDNGSEFFRFEDRKGSGFLLSPTHEEEITQLVADEVHSYRDLPIRAYQIGRKYRDELRPRGGLLRGREFIMKDLYTFDVNEPRAIETYNQVRNAYNNFFDELKVPYLVANADSGAMGGDLSHEYHFPNHSGEDEVISCDTCDLVRNEELVDMPETIVVSYNIEPTSAETDQTSLQKLNLNTWFGVSKDELGLVEIVVPETYEVNHYAVKALVSDLDSSGARVWKVNQPDDSPEYSSTLKDAGHQDKENTSNPYRLVIFDHRISQSDRQAFLANVKSDYPPLSSKYDLRTIEPAPSSSTPLRLTKFVDGDTCPKCHTGKLKVQKAIEVGHTFHLGTRYSDPLNALIAAPSSETDNSSEKQPLVPIQMGCHGIGISRLISALASCLLDSTGLNWPRVIAPFEVIIIPGKDHEESAINVYDQLLQSGLRHPSAHTSDDYIDAVLDDRSDKRFSWKLKDADLVGYPIVVLLGRDFDKGMVEVQCRRLGVKENVQVENLREFVLALLKEL
ncbi:putative prolyl-trna synthetase [Phaeomoniella chlamydospora]|uniref:proline--tRNA ligase n=1 Tax=Phaeomoniella chlamydospora TaxID=158046 RepID=A0A0G2GQ82_PHACM|nr:putative prolyl-trna synthetase [Phaeomoniella chlamydospora]